MLVGGSNDDENEGLIQRISNFQLKKRKYWEVMDRYCKKYGNSFKRFKVYARKERMGLGFEDEREESKRILFRNEFWRYNINRLFGASVETIQNWTNEEEEVYKKCILKYGCGNYSVILKKRYLIGKNKEQLYNKLKKLLGFVAVTPWHDVHVDFTKFHLTEKQRKEYILLSDEGSRRFALRYNEDVNW